MNSRSAVCCVALSAVLLAGSPALTTDPGQITFQTTEQGAPVLWRIAAQASATAENLTVRFDHFAQFPGSHFGPLTVSPDGMWYTFHSERFDADSQGWAGLTIAKADLTSVETIRSGGQTIHAEGLAQATAGGLAVVFGSGGGPHTRDLFIVERTTGGWNTPRLLTGDSPFAFNYQPTLSADGSKVAFDAGNTSFPSTNACEVRLDGAAFRVLVSPTDGPAGSYPSPGVHSPAYEPDGSLVFEAEWGGGERIWKRSAAGGVPALVNATYTNDNSPNTLPDGRIASLYLPSGVHQIKVIKVMDSAGRNALLLTPSSVDVDDIGIGCGPAPFFNEVPGKITVSPKSLNMATVKIGAVKQKQLLISNSGAGTLTGTLSGLDLPFAILGSSTFSVAPNGKLKVTVQFRPTQRGNFSDSLVISSNDSLTPTVSIPIKGRGK